MFYCKTYHFRVIARSAATRQSLSDRCGIPWRSTRARNNKIPNFRFVPQGHHIGASPEAPFHAGASPHFPCAASFTRSKIVFHRAALPPRTPSVPVCLPEIRPYSLLLFKIDKNPPRDLFKKTAPPLLTSIPVYRYTRIVGSRRQNAAFHDRQPLSPSRCRPASSFRLIFSDGLRRIDAAASMRCTRRRGCPNGRFLPTPTDSLPPPTAAVQAPGALQFPPGRRPHPIPD